MQGRDFSLAYFSVPEYLLVAMEVSMLRNVLDDCKQLAWHVPEFSLRHLQLYSDIFKTPQLYIPSLISGRILSLNISGRCIGKEMRAGMWMWHGGQDPLQL